MTDNAKLERALERVRTTRADYEAKQDDVAQARERYYEAVRSLNGSGMSLREVAETLGLSHQRVHQMINEAESRGSKIARGVRKASKAGGVVVLLALLASSMVWLNATRDSEPDATPSPSRVASVEGTSPRARAEMGDRTARRCISVSAGQLRKAAHQAVTRIRLDRAAVRTIRDTIIDLRRRRLDSGVDVDVTYTLESAAGTWDC